MALWSLHEWTHPSGPEILESQKYNQIEKGPAGLVWIETRMPKVCQ